MRIQFFILAIHDFYIFVLNLLWRAAMNLFVLMNFVNQFEKTEESVSNNPLMKESSQTPQDSEESVESSTLIHDGAELVVLDSLVRDSLVSDSLVKDSLAPDTVKTVIDTSAKKKELPASATIFISSSEPME